MRSGIFGGTIIDIGRHIRWMGGGRIDRTGEVSWIWVTIDRCAQVKVTSTRDGHVVVTVSMSFDRKGLVKESDQQFLVSCPVETRDGKGRCQGEM